MAKPRKHKSEEHAPESSGGVVLHQKLCLSIDMEKRVIYGHTEMQVSISEGGYIALHADNMTIRSVSVDGEPAEFEFIPHYQVFEEEKRWGSVSCSTSAADVACSTYLSSLEDEMVPNLLIACHKSTNSMNDQQGQHNQSNGGDVLPNSFGEHVNGYDGPRLNKNVKLVCIDYMVDRAETGIHFWNNVLITDNQIRRAHCWFPCMDSTMQCCTFDLEITVNLDFVAISNGSLLYQVLSKDDPPRKTYVYQLSVPVSVGWISLAVAPFEILPDGHNGIITHMCLSPNLSKLQNTVGFFHNAFSHYEDYLSMSFPFGSYKQVFIPPEISVSSINMGASMCIFSSELLFDEKVIDQTINTRIKLAHALARQWFGVYIVAEELNDEWLLDGLAGYLTDSFTKRFLGNNEARYRRHKANCAVCKADVSGATALSSAAATTDLYGTQSIGLYGKIRSWKATAILQMLEKQMGPDSFRKILQNIVHKPVDTTRSVRTLSTKEFRHLANKIGNLERPFLKEFFPRWVESCGCPVMRMGISYNKRRNMIELAVIRDCTAKLGPISTGNLDSETRDGDTGWPGMMSIRVHELDGMYDHPSLPMAGDAWQLLEIQCHSKLAAKRIQKLRKGSKPDGSDDNADATSTMDMRNGMDSPLLWIRVDPEMEYLAEIHLHQPIQMLVNQLEKDKDVVAQAEAIASLEDQPQFSFSIVNALNNFLCDQKGFWRVRIEAAYALARTASEETDLTGLHNLVKFYKTRRFDEDIGLPRPNDFHDVPEYFVLEAIPHAISLVRTSDKKSPREAVEFVLQLLKYNDNNGNPYSDVYWLAALVLSIGELEFCQQSILLLPSLLKRIDRLLQFDCLMPSYNGILTISCIRTLAQIALKLSSSVPVDHVCQLIKPFRETEKTKWKVRIEASRALLDLEFYHKGVNAALSLFMNFLADEPSFRGEVKLAMHVTHLCQLNVDSELGIDLDCPTQVALLRLLASRKAFNNVFLRHHLFCIFQIIAGRSPTLFGVQRIPAQSMVTSEFYINHIKPALLKLGIIKPQEHVADAPSFFDGSLIAKSAKDPDTVSNCSERSSILKLKISRPQEPPADASHLGNAPSDMEAVKDNDAVSNCSEKTTSLKLRISGPQGLLTETRHPPDAEPVPEVIKDTDTVSICSEKKVNILKIKVKQPSSSSKADDADHTKDHSQGGQTEAELGPCSSMSVDAPTRVGDNEPLHANKTNIEEVNSSHDQESRMSASIGCAKLVNIDEVGKELQCTADSRNVATHEDRLSPNSDVNEGAAAAQENSHLQEPTHLAHDLDEPIAVIDRQEGGEEKKSKKEKERKRKRDDKSSDRKPLDDSAYLEHKRQKKEKKRLEKELAKKLKREAKASLDLQKSSSSVDLKENPFRGDLEKAEETTEPNAPKSGEIKAEALQASFTTKFKIKLKGKIIGGS